MSGRSVSGRGGLLAILAATACRGEVAVQEWSLVDTTQAEARTVEELPPRPELPAPDRGRLSAVSAGNYRLSGQWEAEAVRCESLALLELFAGVRGMRILLVIRERAEGAAWGGTYPLILPDSVATRAPPAAHLAVQVFQDREATGFQAIDGEVDFTADDGFVSGRFDSVLRESRSYLLVRYIGAFDRVETTFGDMEYCDQLGGVVDSALVDSAAVDTEEPTDTLD